MKKHNNIFIKYAANPNMPYTIAHKAGIHGLTVVRTKEFKLNEWERAWEFLMECTSPITKLEQILWAFPRKKAFDLLESIDSLKKEDIESIDILEIEDLIGGEEVEDTLEYLNNETKTYSDLL